MVVATHDDRISQLADRVIGLAPHFSPTSICLPRRSGSAQATSCSSRGDPSDFIYEVDSGRLEVYRVRANGGHEPVATVGPHQYVGELGPILNFPRSATVRALEDSVVTPLSVRVSGSGPSAFRKMRRRQLNNPEPDSTDRISEISQLTRVSWDLLLPPRVSGISGVRRPAGLSSTIANDAVAPEVSSVCSKGCEQTFPSPHISSSSGSLRSAQNGACTGLSSTARRRARPPMTGFLRSSKTTSPPLGHFVSVP